MKCTKIFRVIYPSVMIYKLKCYLEFVILGIKLMVSLIIFAEIMNNILV